MQDLLKSEQVNLWKSSQPLWALTESQDRAAMVDRGEEELREALPHPDSPGAGMQGKLKAEGRAVLSCSVCPSIRAFSLASTVLLTLYSSTETTLLFCHIKTFLKILIFFKIVY